MARTSAKPTISDVARRAGVSVATVSYVLNPPTLTKPVAPSTRQRILRAIQQLNYRRNEQARSLRVGRSGMIGLVVSDVAHPYPAMALGVVEEILQNRGYRCLLADARYSALKERSYLQALQASRVEGVLFIGSTDRVEDEGILELVKSGTPVVLTEREIRREKIPCLLLDNAFGVGEAVRHLLSHGHQRIGHLTGPRAIGVTRERLAAYRATMKKAGFPALDSWIAEAGFSLEGGYQAAQQLLDQLEPVTAIVAMDDYVSIGALRAIRDRGLRVPHDVALIGFGNTLLAPYTDPPLTSIDQAPQVVYGKAANMLLDQIERKAPAKDYRHVIRPTLVLRASCGCKLTSNCLH